MSVRPFVAGDPVPGASRLNEMVQVVNRLEGTPGAHSSGVTLPSVPIVRTPIVVVARVIGGSGGDPNAGAPLSAHAYTISMGGQQLAIDYRSLIVAVQPELIDAVGEGSLEQQFTPAAVVGDLQAAASPWRARGWIERFAAQTAGGVVDSYAVMLYGLAPHRGC